MEFNPFDNNRYVSHRSPPPYHHRDINRHHHLPPPPFNLPPPPPPPLYSPLPPAPPPAPPASHHSNFTFLSHHHSSSPRVSSSRLPEFDNPYSMPRPDLPRVSPYRSTSNYNSDSDFNSARYDFVDSYIETGNANQNLSQRLVWNGKSDDIHNYDRYDYKFGNVSQGSEFGMVNRENYQLGNRRVLDDVRDENRSWRSLEMEHNANDIILARRERERERGRECNIYESDRISNREREEREESFNTPKKKSVLLRIGKPNKVRNSRSYEKKVNSLRGKEKEREKDQVVNHRIDEGRGFSSVNLDVSFKSNGLVAKTIATDYVSPGKSFTPRSRKGKKVTMPSSAPTILVDHSVRSGNPTHVSDSPSSSEKTPHKVKNITVSSSVSVSKSSGNTSAEVTPRKIRSSIVSGIVSGTKGLADSRVKRSAGDTVLDESHKRSVFCESPSYMTRKKKKVASVSSHASGLKFKESEVLTLKNKTNTPLSPNLGVMHLEGKNSSVVKYDDIVSLPSPDVLNVNKLDADAQATSSNTDIVLNDSGRSILLDSITNKSSHLVDSLDPQEIRFDKDTSIPSGSLTMSVSGLDNAPTNFQNEYIVSGIGREKDVTQEPCRNEKYIFLENGSCKESSEGIIAGCTYNASLSGLSINKIQEGCADSYLAFHETVKVSSPGFGLKSITVSDTEMMDAEAKIVLQTDIEKACLDVGENSVGGHGDIELSSADGIKFDECTVNEYSSHRSPSSPSSSDIGITIIEGENIVSTCPVDDMGNQISPSGAIIPENALVGDCPKDEVPTMKKVEVGSEIICFPNAKRKRYTGDIQSHLSGTRTFDRHEKVGSPVFDEDNLISYFVREVSEENDKSSGAGKLLAASQSVTHSDIRVHGCIINIDRNSPIKKLKVFHNDEKIAPGGGSALSLEQSQNNFKGEKKELVNDILINTKIASFPTEDTGITNQALDSARKNPTSAVPRVFTGPSSTHINNPKRAIAVNHHAVSRSWHRPGTLIASVPANKTFSTPVSTLRISPGKARKIQGSSYIRKGNSLVRKPGMASANSHASSASFFPVYGLNPSGKDDTRKTSGSENKVGANGSASWLRTRDKDENTNSSRSESKGGIANSASRLLTGGTATSERPRTAPLPQNNKSIDLTAIYAGDRTPSHQANSPSDSCPETALTLLQQTSNVDRPNSLEVDTKFSKPFDYLTGLNRDLGSQRVLDKGKSGETITYVKRKSNQLIATRNVNESSIWDVDKIQAVSSDSYYKRRSNQLIRASVETQTMPREVPDSIVNPEGKRTSSVTSSRRLSNKVWRLGNTQSSKKTGSLLFQKPNLFPWKRAASWKSSMHNSPYTSTNNSLSLISRKLLISRKRDTIYTRSRRGYSLRISKLLSVGGSSLKWSKSIEKNSKRANEEATLAVAAVQKTKREQNHAPSVVTGTKRRNNISRERIFRIGSVRYKMDPTRRTLQRISDIEPSCSLTSKSENNLKKSYVPRRLVIGNDEYVRIGNCNQLIRDPKKRTRALASEKVRWSLHTARLRLARKSKYCQFFTRFGQCNKDDGKCPYIHDSSKIAVCTKYLSGSCTSVNCKLTHKVIPERMQDCSYYQQGLCSNHSCPYRHVNVNANASICEGFLKGYCVDGNECRKKHTYVCPQYEETGICPQGSKCKLHHPNKRSKGIKRKSLREQKNAHVRYFGSRSLQTIGSRTVSSKKLHLKNNDDTFHVKGKFIDYISLDTSDDEAGDNFDPSSEHITMCSSDVQVADVDEQIKPVRVMYKISGENHLQSSTA